MLALLGAALLALQQTAGQPEPRVQLGVRVVPETVTVGDPFRVEVRLRAPRGAEVDFPVGPDSLASIEAVDPRVVRTLPDTTGVDRVATYRLVAWDTGAQVTHFGDAAVALGGRTRLVPVGDVRVTVRSVLPADTALHVPKPARAVLDAPRDLLPLILIGLAALALLALFAWLWRRRRRRAVSAAPPVDALAYAEREFDRIEALGLLEAGERGRFVALVTEVLRHYLALRIPNALTSLTSTELVLLLRDNPHVPADRLAVLLGESDLIKFARRPVTTERARHLGREVRAIVRDVERAATAPPAQEAA